MKIITSRRTLERNAIENLNDNCEFKLFLESETDPKELGRTLEAILDEANRLIDCRKCANCCKYIPPSVRPGEIKSLSQKLGLDPKEFIAQYLVKEGHTHFMDRQPCPFLKDNQCVIYDDRPKDCRSYPHLHKRDFTLRLFEVIQNYSMCPIVVHVYEGLKKHYGFAQSAE